LSKVKYPDKEKIRIQIDEILDKSELFDATEDKSSTYTNEKKVKLKPEKQPLPVGKYISVAAAIAAIVIFVISKNIPSLFPALPCISSFNEYSNIVHGYSVKSVA